ncbi:MAG: BamA/TamA family outer membrane protein [Acidobacteriota bacterium]
MRTHAAQRPAARPGRPSRRLRRPALLIAALATICFTVGVAPMVEAQYNTPYGTRFGKNKVTYEAFDFWKYSAPHFDVYYYPEEEQHLDEVVAFAEDAYRIVSEKMNHELSERTPIIFYQTAQEFQQTHVLPFFLPEAVAAFAEPSQNRLVLPVDAPPEELHKLLIHEITHIFEFDYFFGSRLGSALRAQPPGWVMEGFAEHTSDNLTSLDEMMLRDVVLADEIPTLVQMTYNRGFFIDYVLGDVVWDYIEEEYGPEGVRIFLAEIRRDLGQDIERDLERAFNVTPQQFNRDFREYLRGRYLTNFLERQEAPDFADNVMAGIPLKERPFAFSPVVSPDGSQFAAISVDQKALNVDVFTFDLETGRRLENLTGGLHNKYESLIGQGVTVGFEAGNDLSWSPDGNTIALFGRTPPTRTLYLIDARDGDVIKEFRTGLDQALSPSIGPDGRVIFGAHRNGVRDIYLYDPETDDLSNLTQDELYDYAPVWSPDGRSIVFASHVLGHKKLFRIDLARPQQRVQLTFGLSNDTQPSFSEDGSELFFVSDRTGEHNIYGMELADGSVRRYTNILHGAFFPQQVPGDSGRRLLFSSYSDQQYELYTMDLQEAFETFSAESEALPDERVAELERRREEIASVELDEGNKTQSAGGGWHISNVQIAGGFTSQGTILSNTAIQFSDMFGNQQVTAILGSVESQRNYSAIYENQKRRLNWGAMATSQRSFFFTFDPINREIDREAFFELDGGEIFADYPLGRDWRMEFSVGYYRREFGLDALLETTTGGVTTLQQRFSDGTFMPIGVGFVGDKARFKEWGPFAGRRVNLGFEVAPGIGDLNFYEATADFREYAQVTANSLFALRVWGGAAFGDDPGVFFFGGLNQLRGFDFLQFSGSRAVFTNLEYRFPVIWEARLGDFAIRHIRGTLFFDVGAAWFEDQDFTPWEDGRLQDARASFGLGISFNLGPLPLNWYLAQKTDLDSLIGDPTIEFYIGPTF